MTLAHSSALATLLLTSIALAADSGNAHLRVWTATETRHILRSDPPGASATAKLSCARNEWRGIQILLRCDSPIRGIRVEAADLLGPDGAILKASAARLYRQHQIELKQGTSRNDTFKPDWYPDALIPFTDPLTGRPITQARILAIPFDLPANETHGFWIDLYAPPGAKPGLYRGAYKLTAQNHVAVEIPVELNIWDFALPATPTLVTAFGSPAERMRSYYAQRAKEGKEQPPKDWAAVATQCAQILSEHRVDATPPADLLRAVEQPDGRFQIPAERTNQLRQFIDLYHVNAIQTPHPSSIVKDPIAQRERLGAWLSAFDRMAKDLDRPQVVFYTYLKDEPNTLDDYRYVQSWGRAVRDAKSVVKVLVVEQTWTAPGQGGADSAWGDLYGAVDIWCPLFSLHREDSAEKRLAAGEMVWTYTALCQGKPTPWWHIDYPLLNYRVPAWIAWRCHMSGLLYWGGMSYWNQVEDPWVQAPFYQQGKNIYHGEGSLVYPAAAVGYDGIAPSIRLKALRDSIEDFEYLAILQRRGQAAPADAIIAPLAGSFFDWDKEPAAYESARARLAAQILSSSRQRP